MKSVEKSDAPLDAAVAEAAAQLHEAAAAKKCWPCGCLHSALDAIERALPDGNRPAELGAAVRAAGARLEEVRYDCLGCEVCYPALALNALGEAGVHTPDPCPVEKAAEREGWPPLPGAYTVLRYQAPVAVCTLTDEGLGGEVASLAGPEVAIVGSLQTENLGIERLILNVLANPHIRFLVVCGEDSCATIGHLPGQSLVALARWGIDDRGRIANARGRRPRLGNIASEAVDHFRRTVEVIDLIGQVQARPVLAAAAKCAISDPGAAQPYAPQRVVAPLAGHLPARMVSDPAGYFVVYVDRRRRLLSLEHYRNDGMLDAVFEGATAVECYTPAIERELVSRLDHAAYLGRQLARAEHALVSGNRFVQDAAPVRTAPAVEADCRCDPSRGEVKP